MKTILVPVDFSGVTPRVVDEAVKLAGAADGGRVVLLHVTRAPQASEHIMEVPTMAELTEALERAGERRLAELVEPLTLRGVNAESLRVTGSPVSEIVQQAEKRAADYIVIGSHGHTPFYELVVGSIASGVLRHAPCPVLVVPPLHKDSGTAEAASPATGRSPPGVSRPR
jgi:nucleotide-binding universal stress UspA family protein